MSLNATPSISNSLKLSIQYRYQIHRVSRNEQQRAKILDPCFGGWLLDPVLQKLVDSRYYPDYIDPRNCLVFWARPPMHLRRLIGIVQEKLLGLIPSMTLGFATRSFVTAL